MFEELNDYQINVLELQEDLIITPLRTSRIKRKETINLLLIHNEDNSHYVWIKDLSRLFHSKTTHHKKYICEYCLSASYEKVEN